LNVYLSLVAVVADQLLHLVFLAAVAVAVKLLKLI
jgi:hypothetical protein